MQGALADVFLASAPAARGRRSEHAIDAALVQILEACRVAWPHFTVDTRGFVQFLAIRVGREPDPFAALAAWHLTDLYLAFACLSGDHAAVGALEQHFIANVPSFIARRCREAAVVREVQQTVRQALLLPREDRPAKLEQYSGRGPLGGWLRVIAVRAVIDLQRKSSPEQRTAPGASRELVDPELAYVKARYAPLLSEAFAKTIASLPVKQRTVLRMYFVEGLTTDAIARVHRVDGSTVVRWIARARSTILEGACRLVTERLDIPPSELESLLEIVRSQIDMTLERVLA